MDLDRERECRAASAISVVPLGVVVVSAFLPAVHACNEVTTPAHEIASGAIFGLPPFLLAGLLAIATGISLVGSYRRRPPRPRVWLGPYRQHALAQEPPAAPGRVAAIGAAIVSTAGAALSALCVEPNHGTAFAAALAMAGIHVALTWRVVRRMDRWARWTALLALWAVQATVPVGLILGGGAFASETPGATLYVLATAVVGLTSLAVLVRGYLRARAWDRRHPGSGSFTFRNDRQTSRS